MAVAEAAFHPWISRAALFSLVYGSTERELVALCYDAQNAQLAEPAIDQSRILDKVKVHLTEVVGLDLSRLAAWSDLRNYSEIRHALLHARGIVDDPKRQKSLQQFARRLRTFEVVVSTNRLWLEAGFVPNFCDTVERLWRDLTTLWEHRFPFPRNLQVTPGANPTE
jgi:hypothetical protein